MFSQVAYLDNVDFGTRCLPDVVPRVLVWKGNRIREYAELDKCSGNSYGKRPVKRLTVTTNIQVSLVYTFLYFLLLFFCVDVI